MEHAGLEKLDTENEYGLDPGEEEENISAEEEIGDDISPDRDSPHTEPTVQTSPLIKVEHKWSTK